MFVSVFFNDTASTEIYTLPLHDALPISPASAMGEFGAVSVVSGHIRGLTNTLPLHVEVLYNDYESVGAFAAAAILAGLGDRKSTRLNSSHANISYAAFCLKKNKSYTNET